MTKDRLHKTIAIFIPIVSILYLLYVYYNVPKLGSNHISCSTYVVFGIYCAGCGLTRQVHHFLHGNFLEAIKYNVLGWMFYIAVIYAYIVYFRWAFCKKNPPNVPIRLAISYVVIIVVYSILRNIPIEPFIYLAP